LLNTFEAILMHRVVVDFIEHLYILHCFGVNFVDS